MRRPPNDITERWSAWLIADLIVGWTLGYACATAAWDVAVLALVLLVICVVFTFQEHHREVHDAVQRALRPWRRASERKQRRETTWT